MKGTDLLKLRSVLKAGKRLSDAQVAQLAELRHAENVGKYFVQVEKLSLRPGEELMSFVGTMLEAVQTNRIVLADGSLDAWLQGIFDDHVIVQDFNTGRFFKASFERGSDGSIVFSEPVEVRMEWVPTNPSAESSDEVERAVAKRAPAKRDFVEVSKSNDSKWSGVLPSRVWR